MLTEGIKAPDFTILDHNGKTFNLSSRLGSKWTILYFYPKSFTPGCTKQACTYSTSVARIRELEGEVFGISGDTPEKQKQFKEKYRLNFTILADHDKKVMELYKVKMRIPFFKISKRVTFILDKDLVIRKIYKDVDPVADADNIIKFIKENS